MKKKLILYRVSIAIGDWILLNFAFLMAFWIKFRNTEVVDPFREKYVNLLIFLNISWILMLMINRIYKQHRTISIERMLRHISWQLFLHVTLVGLFIFTLKGYYYSREMILYLYIIFGSSLVLFRIFLFQYYRFLRAKGYDLTNIVLVGIGEMNNHIIKLFSENRYYGLNVIAIYNEEGEGGDLYRGDLEDLKREIQNNGKEIDEIICTYPLAEKSTIRELIEAANQAVIRFRLAADMGGFFNRRVAVEFVNNLPLLSIRKEPLESGFNRMVKRIFDILFSLLLIILVFSWLFPIMAILIKLDSKGPVFFKQPRSGRYNEVFNCIKFRSMKVMEKEEIQQASKDDDRITRVGRFLRKTSLDELPQFFNVLQGAMSVVGPRPHAVQHTEEYSEIVVNYMVRHFVKPGVTGLAQVKGYRGETETRKKMQDRIRIDVWYIENWSFLLDVKIIFLTVMVLFKGDENAY